MTTKTNIVLILKSGGDFKMSDVYLLVSHINRYWENKTNRPSIYCYTDLVTEEKEVVGLTIRRLPNAEWQGWWAKMNLFAPELKSLRPFLYLDLDTAVINSIESLVPPEEKQNQFITLRDFYQPQRLASGVMWVPDNAEIDKVHTEWLRNVESHTKIYRGDQNFIASITKADLYWQDVFPADYITTFKPNRQWRMLFPQTSAVVCFHGQPRIPTAALTVDWVKKYAGYEI